MFFNQTQVNFRLTARETSDTPILSAVLYIDKKIANKAAFELDISRPYFHSENVFYWNYFDTPRFRLQAAKFEGNRSLIFNVSSDISECSTGTRTFVMVPVKVYALSLVGSFYIIVYARGPSVNRNPYYVDAEGLVDSGKDILTIHTLCVYMQNIWFSYIVLLVSYVKTLDEMHNCRLTLLI